jgi:hypothetical protein
MRVGEKESYNSDDNKVKNYFPETAQGMSPVAF